MKKNLSLYTIFAFILTIIGFTISANLYKLDTLTKITDISLSKYSTEIVVGDWSYVIPTIEPIEANEVSLIWSTSDEKVCIVEDGMIKSIGIGEAIVTVSSSNSDVSKEVSVKVLDPSEISWYVPNGTGGYPDIVIEGPFYVDGVLIVNKQYTIPEGFATEVNDEAYSHLLEMQAAAKELGYSLPTKSSYRTHQRQINKYIARVKKFGVDRTDLGLARPGHSEHESGLAFDVGTISQAFGNTKSGIWLKENCYKYGFIIRYPKGKEDITGYGYEPWHIRYLGVELATKIYESGKTLEEYFNLV